jgi:hypothetical protein
MESVQTAQIPLAPGYGDGTDTMANSRLLLRRLCSNEEVVFHTVGSWGSYIWDDH